MGAGGGEAREEQGTYDELGEGNSPVSVDHGASFLVVYVVGSVAEVPKQWKQSTRVNMGNMSTSETMIAVLLLVVTQRTMLVACIWQNFTHEHWKC